MTNNRQKEVREALVPLIGRQRTDELLTKVDVGKGLTQLEERQLATQAQLNPLTPQQAQAINEYLGTNIQATGQSDKK